MRFSKIVLEKNKKVGIGRGVWQYCSICVYKNDMKTHLMYNVIPHGTF
jgi:hypothetical protein